MGDAMERLGMGWLPDLPDFRDYTAEQDEVDDKLKLLGQKDSIKTMLKKVGASKSVKAPLPASTDLRVWCSPVEDHRRYL